MDIIEQDILSWVDGAGQGDDKEFRQAVYTILAAISNDQTLKANMVLKGGILMAVRYQSHRYTKDIDLSSEKGLSEITPEATQKALDDSLALTVEVLDYDLDCKVQSCKRMPSNQKNPTFPSINLKVGYAYKGTAKHRRLLVLQSPTSISIDYSLNELTPNVEKFNLTEGEEILVYSLTDLVAEKIRSILQQAVRNRSRRQDIFDIHMILSSGLNVDEVEKGKILRSLIEKSESRNITPNEESLDDLEIRQRSQAEYHTLQDELAEGQLPDFDESYDLVVDFYRSLPWPKH